MRQAKRALILPLVCVFIITGSLAPRPTEAGIPTIDVASIVQETISVIQQIEQVVQLYNQIENQVVSIANQVEQFENMNGDYFKDLLLNDWLHKEARRWAPESYGEVMNLYESYGSWGRFGNTKSAGWQANDQLRVPDHWDFFEHTEQYSNSYQRWENHEKSSMALVGVSEGSYERVADLIDESEGLIADIPNAADDKAAQDLSNRIAAQNQIVLAELIRVQSAQAATQGRKQLYDHALKGEDKRAAQVREIRDFRYY